MAQRFACDCVRECTISRIINPARCKAQRCLKRLPPAQYAIKQFERCTARSKTSNFGNDSRLSKDNAVSLAPQ
jgi:hypothetical protein